MSEISNKKYKYSKTQYFFWLLSGAEISILKDCPTDYNRQAGIGFTIFMTTLLAFFSGSYAGYYFAESYFSAIIFGTIWASLIFSIDRSMVVTLKKDPTKTNQNFWPAFLSRAVLAILIAFIISIPLELLIFKENIDLHMDKYKLDQVYNVQKAAKRNEAIDEKQQILNNDNLVLEKVEGQLSKGEPQGDPEYDKLKLKIKPKQQEYDALIINLNKAQREYKNADKNFPTYYDNISQRFLINRKSIQWRNNETKRDKINQAQGNLNKFDKKGLDDLNKQKDEYIDNWISNLKGEQKRLNENISNTSSAINQGLASADTIKNKFEEKIQDKKGFVLRFMILEDLAVRYKKNRKQVKVNAEDSASIYVDSSVVAADSLSVLEKTANKGNSPELKATEDIEYNPEGATIFFLLWLIRILFFTIEILPTIAKIATPLGAYDRAIYRKEQDLELELNERTSSYLKQQQILRGIEYEAEQEQTKDRTQIENNLHKEVLFEIASAQNKIAREKIEEFKKKHNKQE
jgi:hypothetical protein